MSARRRAIVAGGGVGGLSAALALARAGLDVVLCERAAAFEEVGAGLQLAPNATRRLRSLGVLSAVERRALAPDQVRLRRARDGRELTRAPLGPIAELRWGAPYLVIHRADLLSALVDAAAKIPAIDLRTGAEVAGFAAGGAGVEVSIQANQTRSIEQADVLIAADGLRSATRERLGLGPGDAPVWSGRVAWRALVPAADAPASARQMETNLWLGPRAHLVHYPLRAGEIINIIAVTEGFWRAEDEKDFWSIRGDPASVWPAYARWHRDARDLIASVREWRRWPLFDRPPTRRWTLPGVALLGDAAHPMQPFLAQGAAQAIEDAVALGDALSAQPDDINAALRRYEQSRATRAAAVVLASRRQGGIYHLRGPMAVARDLTLRSLSPERMLGKLDWLYSA